MERAGRPTARPRGKSRQKCCGRSPGLERQSSKNLIISRVSMFGCETSFLDVVCVKYAASIRRRWLTITFRGGSSQSVGTRRISRLHVGAVTEAKNLTAICPSSRTGTRGCWEKSSTTSSTATSNIKHGLLLLLGNKL